MEDLVIFSDAGIDDIFAIKYLYESGCNIRAIIATSGNGNSRKAYDILKYFFDCNIYLSESIEEKSHYIHNALNDLEIPFCNSIKYLKNNLNKIFISNVTILSLAPLTILESILDRFSDKFDKIIIMGGAYKVSGNESIVAEYNFYKDPSSIKRIIKCEVPKFIIPLDVTNKLRFNKHHITNIKDKNLKYLANTLLTHYETLGDDSIPLHDLTATMFITNPDAFTLKFRHCDIALEGICKGQLIVDEHRYLRKKSNSILVIDVEFSTLYFKLKTILF